MDYTVIWLYICVMKEKRRQRAYKITDKQYDKAVKRAKKEKTHVANLVEDFLIEYGNPLPIKIK